jgi:uncharacterized protein (TIGR02001 family)
VTQIGLARDVLKRSTFYQSCPGEISMKKLLLTAATAALTAPAAPLLAQDSPHTLTANVGLFSEYIFRGVTQTAGDPAIQGGFDYGHSSGLYVGTWASNVSWLKDFGTYSSSSLEWDFYGGFKRNFGSTDFYFDVGTIYYYYPGNKVSGAVSADTWELYAGVGWKWLGLKYSYSLDDYFGARPTGQKTDGTWYLDFFVNYPVGETGFTLIGHYGILDVKDDGNQDAATKASYDDWKIGASYTVPSGFFKGLEAGLYYTDTNVKNSSVTGTNFYTDLNGLNTADDAFVFYVKKTF